MTSSAPAERAARGCPAVVGGTTLFQRSSFLVFVLIGN
jgi:hypothetical protein